MSKKISVIRDDFKIKNHTGGLYCILPYEKLDKEGKAIFKLGYAIDLHKRMENYLTSYPLGVYIPVILENPSFGREKVLRKYVLTEKQYYSQIENFITKKMIAYGATNIYSHTRVQHLNENNEGRTEWFYANVEMITKSFKDAKAKYGGIMHERSLKGINTIANKNKKLKDIYVAEIVYPIKMK